MLDRQADDKYKYLNRGLELSPDFFDLKFDAEKDQARNMNLFSYDDSPHAGLDDLTQFGRPISPTMSGPDMFYTGERSMHINPAAMWNGSGSVNLSEHVDMAASQNFPGMGKILTEYEGPASRNFGQITPPSETDDGLKFDKRTDSGVVPSINAVPDQASRNSFDTHKRQKSRTMSNGTRPSKRARTSVSNEDEDEDEEMLQLEGTGGDNRREKYREKNRVAAAKCRAKKKDHVDHLEDTHRTQSVLNTALKQTEKTLRDELSFWRTQALQHTFCRCSAIQQYNMQKAQNLAAESVFGGRLAHKTSSTRSTSSISHSPVVETCAVHPSRSHSTSETMLASSATAPTELDPRLKSSADPSLAFSLVDHESIKDHDHDRQSSNPIGQHLSEFDEQELKNFVNEATD